MTRTKKKKMETEFIYWRHSTPVGIQVEEVSGCEQKHGDVWRAMALQVYCENGRDGYREVGHLQDGAPILCHEPVRISISHTGHLLVVASLPRTPEATLSRFSPRTALGVDAESWDRAQVLKIRERFLSAAELEMVPADDLEANIVAWTAKEALYKAALKPGLDFREDITLHKLPTKGDPHGSAQVRREAGEPPLPMELYSYSSEGCCVTLAYSPKAALYKRG